MAHDSHQQDPAWKEFIEGPVYPDDQAPWCDDLAYVPILTYPGLRDSIGGRVALALTQAIGLVQAMERVDLLQVVHTNQPAHGLCLGFGMNALEPYDLLQVFKLDQVHAYEWIGAQVIEAAQVLQALRTENPFLPPRIRLYHGTISNLNALSDASIQVVYTANVFNREIPMTEKTFTEAVQEVVRVLAEGGVVLSRGSSGVLEEQLARRGRMLLQLPLVSVFWKTSATD
jgi:hypothetical protein